MSTATVGTRHLPKKLARFRGPQADALRAALASGILVVPAFPPSLDEPLGWSDAVDDWTVARCKAGLASIVVMEDHERERAVVRYETWSDPRREMADVTATRMGRLLDGLRRQDLLESERTNVGGDNEWSTMAIPTRDAFRLAKEVITLEREICWPSHRALAEVMLT